jgi:hypothetical protein
MNLLTQKVNFSGRKNSLPRNRANFLGQNLFFLGRKEWTCFASESVYLPQKAPYSILNRRECLQKARTALGYLETVLERENFIRGERRRRKKEKLKTGRNSYFLDDFFSVFH